MYAAKAQQNIKGKIEKTQAQCRKKLTEVHNAYLAVGVQGRAGRGGALGRQAAIIKA